MKVGATLPSDAIKIAYEIRNIQEQQTSADDSVYINRTQNDNLQTVNNLRNVHIGIGEIGKFIDRIA